MFEKIIGFVLSTSQITFASGKIEYFYDAVGTKQKKKVTNGAVITTTEYAGNYIYRNNALQFISQPEGYLELDGQGGYDYTYQYKDHLGNIRLSYKDISTTSIPVLQILEENNYYPFGLKHKGYNNDVSSNANAIAGKYKYNGKELNDELGLDLYDYGARMYDPALGRWHNIDRLSEANIHLSTFQYGFNNPIRFIDPDGNAPWDVTSAANLYINTWYEWGGKLPYRIGKGGIPQNRAALVSKMSEVSGNTYYEKYGKSGWFWSKADIYKFNMIHIPNGYSMGIDCSGLSRIAFNADPDKKMGDIDDGADNQMTAFKTAEISGTGYLHAELKSIMEGDLVFSTRINKYGKRVAFHVMIATGKIRLKNGIWEFQMTHAPGAGKVVERGVWREFDQDKMIGHTLRDGENYFQALNRFSKNTSTWNDFYNWVSLNNLWSKLKTFN